MTTPHAATGCPVHRGDPIPLSGPRFHNYDPRQLYRELRRDHGAVVPVELPGGVPAWLVIGYQELHYVTSDAELFTRDRTLWNQLGTVPEDWPLWPMVGRPMPSIYFTAGAEHRRHAGLVDAALEAEDPYVLGERCEQIADELIDGFCGRGEADIVTAFAEPLPVLALASVLGFPDEDGPALAHTMKALADGGAEAQAAYASYYGHMSKLLGAKKSAPGDDLVSRLLAHPEPFTDEEYVLDLMAICAAGHLPTADWIGNTVRLMLTDDRFAASLGGARHSIGQAMTEVLWEDTPTQILAGRWVAHDTELGGRHLRAGDMLLLGLAGANADPHIRHETAGPAHSGNSAHFSYSYGEYRCPFAAQQLSEVIAGTGIQVLLDRLPDLDLAVPADRLIRRPSAFLRGMTSLPVRFTPARAVGGRS
ncbi:cytochrome P450 [Nocardia puris]|uniref:cytochrome P450 n=1 Tax=Nocardia puris TaxID=208602 RepID=UPI001896111E|nr:cytochrome P450 [Nocardia puris]MBF6215055.1 cytochrome P450 [Nocardia puris]MBF6367178.1 cytochrome P450 [Nocardia puris]MBF6461845.1 cytochrome P450 [Nocardia puris]